MVAERLFARLKKIGWKAERGEDKLVGAAKVVETGTVRASMWMPTVQARFVVLLGQVANHVAASLEARASRSSCSFFKTARSARPIISAVSWCPLRFAIIAAVSP